MKFRFLGMALVLVACQSNRASTPVQTDVPTNSGAHDKGEKGSMGAPSTPPGSASLDDREGISLTPMATSTAIAGHMADSPKASPLMRRAGTSSEPSIKAGEWDDNANYREYQRYLGTVTDPIRPLDVRARRFLVVRDSNGKPVPHCPITVTDSAQHSITLTTTAQGHAIFFPFAENLTGKDFNATAACSEDTARSHFSLNDDTDGIVDFKLARPRQLSSVRSVDIAFVLDTTGSMSEEIASVKSTIQKVAQTLQGQQVSVRIGLVEYKDQGDPFVTKVYPMTSNLAAFSDQVSGIVASGGGDMPEDMNAGLHAALGELQWNPQAVTRAAFIIGDAPPHLEYPNEADYAADTKMAAHRGIQLFTIAASGMDSLGQAVWRQMAAYTGATNMFVLRGGAGPQSTGGGDPISSCGGTQTNYASGNLDALIVSKIQRELKALDSDPMRIPGLLTDENAK